jgi:hypothetical protein
MIECRFIFYAGMLFFFSFYVPSLDFYLEQRLLKYFEPFQVTSEY